MANKGGRPMLEGVIRYASGKINRAATQQAQRDRDVGEPSAKVVSARDFFSARCFKGGGKGANAGDAIGILWLLGKLDVPDMDDTVLLDCARRWWFGRAVAMRAVGHKTAKLESSSRSEPSVKESKPEREYRRFEAMLLDASDYDSDCLRSLMETDLDGLMASWVSRIVQTETLRYVRLPLVELATDLDYHKLDCARRALVTMAGGEALKRKKAA